VELNMVKSPQACFDVCNTQARVDELKSSMQAILDSGMLSKTDGEGLRGRLQFASNQLFGKRFRNYFPELNMHVFRNLRKVSPELAAALRLMSMRLLATPASLLTAVISAMNASE